jgi:hypothetical protein
VRVSRTDLWEPRGEVPRGHPAASNRLSRLFSCSSFYCFAEALRLEPLGLCGLWPPADYVYIPP